jgi:hypothetical protein
LPYVTETHQRFAAAVRDVQLIPSGLVITRLVPSRLTATNKPLPYVTERHALSDADVRLVQVIPSGLVITRLPVPVALTATNKPLPYVTETQVLFDAGVRDVQVIPSAAALDTTVMLNRDARITPITPVRKHLLYITNNSPLQVLTSTFQHLGYMN